MMNPDPGATHCQRLMIVCISVVVNLKQTMESIGMTGWAWSIIISTRSVQSIGPPRTT